MRHQSATTVIHKTQPTVYHSYSHYSTDHLEISGVDVNCMVSEHNPVTLSAV